MYYNCTLLPKKKSFEVKKKNVGQLSSSRCWWHDWEKGAENALLLLALHAPWWKAPISRFLSQGARHCSTVSHRDAIFLVLKEHSKIYQPLLDSIRQPLRAAQGGVVLLTTDMWKSNQTLNYMAGFLCLHLFKVLTEPQWNNSAVWKSPWKTSFIMKLVGKPEQIAQGLTSQKASTDSVLMFSGILLWTSFCLPSPPTPTFQTWNIWTLRLQADRKWTSQRGLVWQLLQ